MALTVLWGRGRHVWYWLDEGLSLGISSHRLADIPSVLRLDGSPPLYYWILHVWTSVFGTAEAATHALSLLFALASVAAAWWAGRSLFGRRAGWTLTALYAVSPFFAVYANETRMYTLVVLLATLATGAWLHVFVFGRRRHLPLFVVSLALVVYTHNWGLLLAAAAVAALAVPWLARAVDRRRLATDAALGFGIVAVLYLPWVPTLSYQLAHTGAPWAQPPTTMMVRDQLARLVGGTEAVVAIGLGAGPALALLLRRPFSRTAVAVLAATALALGPVVVGWAVSQNESVWTYRYLAVVLPAVLMVVAVGLAGGGRIAMAALVVVAFLAGPLYVITQPADKSNLRDVAAMMRPRLRPGDLVVSPDYGEVPLLTHYLPAGLRYATTDGVVADTSVSDQRDGLDRLRHARADRTVTPLVDALPPGAHVLFVCPPVTGPTLDQVEFITLLIHRCDEVGRLLDADAGLTVTRSFDAFALGVRNTPISARLLTRKE